MVGVTIINTILGLAAAAFNAKSGWSMTMNLIILLFSVLESLLLGVWAWGAHGWTADPAALAEWAAITGAFFFINEVGIRVFLENSQVVPQKALILTQKQLSYAQHVSINRKDDPYIVRISGKTLEVVYPTSDAHRDELRSANPHP